MSMVPTSNAFKDNATGALKDAPLQEALGIARAHSIQTRLNTIAKMPEFEQLRDIGRDLKNHVIANLDTYLLQFEQSVIDRGGQVHWCPDGESARAKVLAAEAAWNTRDPERVAAAYTVDSVWRNRDQFLQGRDHRQPIYAPRRVFLWLV